MGPKVACLVTHGRLSDCRVLLPNHLALGQLPLYSCGTRGKAQDLSGLGALICRERVTGILVTPGCGETCAPETPVFYR